MDIVAKIVEFLVEPIGRQLGYLIFYNKNVRKLRKQVDVLISISNNLQPRIEAAHRNGENIVEDVLDWQVQVDNAKVEAHSFKKHCWNTSRYSLSRKAKKMTQDVIVLQQKGDRFITGIIAFPPSPEWPELHPTTSVESNETSFMVNDILETLKDDKMYIVGIHGTNRDDMKRLVSYIYRRTKDENQFEDVAIAVERHERKIQGEIAYWLGLKFDSKIDAVRRHRLSKRLVDNRKKLILLDDVCEGLSLEAIGIPFGEGEENKTCKIIVTSSDKSICEKMNTQKNYKLVVRPQMLLFGGHNGVPWNDKAHTTIRSIIVAYNRTGICSFQTEYDDNGHWSRSSNHHFARKSTHHNEEKIELKHPDEFLVSVSGFYKSESNHVVLHSLKFESNKQTFGPFGPETEYDSNGRSAGWIYHGSNGGYRRTVIKIPSAYGAEVQLDYPGEFIITVSGFTHSNMIVSLTIETNRNKYGPFGNERGIFLSFPSNNTGKIVGFYGSSGAYLNKLGAYIEPFPAQNPTTLFAQVGGIGGRPWDDGAAHSTIRQIILKVFNVIVQIKTEYDKNGRSDWSSCHEINSTHSVEVIKLDYPGEFLISMSGTTRVYGKWHVVSSLKFQSNTRTYGPFGDTSGDPFSTSPSTSGKIVGFHGNSGVYLESIGAHFEPFSNS